MVLILDGTLKIPCECAQVLPALRNYACLFILINAHELEKKEKKKKRVGKAGEFERRPVRGRVETGGRAVRERVEVGGASEAAAAAAGNRQCEYFSCRLAGQPFKGRREGARERE